MGGSRLSLAMVVAAAGFGTRLNSRLPKQYVPLLGIPMLQRTLSALSGCVDVDALAVVVNFQDVEYCQTEITMEHIEKVVCVAPGGDKRPLSVRNGLRALAEKGTWDLVGIHDGARPLVTLRQAAARLPMASPFPLMLVDGWLSRMRSPQELQAKSRPWQAGSPRQAYRV